MQSLQLVDEDTQRPHNSPHKYKYKQEGTQEDTSSHKYKYIYKHKHEDTQFCLAIRPDAYATGKFGEIFSSLWALEVRQVNTVYWDPPTL